MGLSLRTRRVRPTPQAQARLLSFDHECRRSTQADSSRRLVTRQHKRQSPAVQAIEQAWPSEHSRRAERRSGTGNTEQHPEASRLEVGKTYALCHRHRTSRRQFICLCPGPSGMRCHWHNDQRSRVRDVRSHRVSYRRDERRRVANSEPIQSSRIPRSRCVKWLSLALAAFPER